MEILKKLNVENPFKLKIQLRLADTDNLGHINNAAFVLYMETARTEWHAHVRKKRALEVTDWDWILGGIYLRFVKELFLSDELYVYLWCSNVGNKSWDFAYAIVNQREELIAKAKTTQISFDYAAHKSAIIASDILGDLNSRKGDAWDDL